MTIYKLYFSPLLSEYSFTLPSYTTRIETMGGFGKYRQTFIDMSITLSASWKLLPAEYDEFMNFFRVATNYGEYQFLLDLAIESSTITEHNCYFTNPKISGLDGKLITVSDSIFVQPLITNSTNDETIIANFELDHE